jgi:CRP-like cAMP-binding protein
VPFFAGDDPGGIFGVLEGALDVHIASDDGESKLATIVGPGTWFGYWPFVRQTPRPMRLSYNARELSWLLKIELADLKTIAEKSSRHQRAIMSLPDHAFDVAVAIVDTLLIRDPVRRIVGTILRVSQAIGNDRLQITQTELGQMSNCDRKVVNRALGHLAASDLITHAYGQISIPDRQALRAFVATD